MHGCAKGAGAPRGNANALKHGHFTREAIAERQMLSRMLREMRETLRTFDEACPDG